MLQDPIANVIDELQFWKELRKDLKYLSPVGFVTALFTLLVFHAKNVAPVSDKWLTDIFADHISFNSIGFAFFSASIALSAAGALNPGKAQRVLIGFGLHVTRRLLAYCSASFGFLAGFIAVVIGHWLWTDNPKSLATGVLMAMFGFFLVTLPFLSAVLVQTAALPPDSKRQQVFLALLALSFFCFLIPLFLGP